MTSGAEAAPAPWRLEVAGVVWAHRAVPGAARFHQPGLPYDRAVPVTVGGLMRYPDSPVGPYVEVWASPTPVLRGGELSLGVPFMAVDSDASVRGGRENWALPKTLATFGPGVAEGEGWSVRVRVVSRGLRVPFAVAGHLLQVAADGRPLRTPARVRGVGRLARVHVEATHAWLAAGRHPAFTVERATLVVGEAS